MPKPRKYPVAVKFPANEAEPVEILLHGPIGKSFWDEDGISAKDFTNELSKIPKGRAITLGINSQGGGVGEGLAIYNAVKRRGADVTARIDGYALSIASVLPLAAHKVVSPESSIWMIHNAHMMSAGNAAEHRKDADLLDTHDGVIVAAYVAKTGKTEDEIKAAMADETWFSGVEAKEWGLCDETTEGEPALNDFDPGKAPVGFFKVLNCDSQPEPIAYLVNNFAYWNHALNSATLARHQGQQTNQPKEPTMNKTKILAMLKLRGVELPADASDEVIYAALETASKPPANAPANVIPDPAIRAELDAVKAQLLEEKKTRITAAVNQCVTECRITNAQAAGWIKRCIADETLLADVQALEPKLEGAAAILNVSVGASNPLEKIKEEKDPAKRLATMKRDWVGIYADACLRDTRLRRTPLDSNTYSGTLVTSFLMDGALTDLQNMWAPLRAFSMDFSTDPYKPLATGVLKHVTAGAATQTDATNFESGNSTVAPISVTMHQYTQSFQVSNSDLQSGLRMENLVTINVANFANKVTEVATAPITTANFTNTPVTTTAELFNFANLASLQASLKKSPIKNLILDGSYIARIANTPGFFQAAGVVGGSTSAWKAFGWDLIAQLTDWTGAGTNVQGFACNPQAIVGITGLPVTPPNIPGGIFQTQTFTVPGLEVSVALSSWFNPATRTMWTSYDIMLGVAVGDATAGTIVQSA